MVAVSLLDMHSKARVTVCDAHYREVKLPLDS